MLTIAEQGPVELDWAAAKRNIESVRPAMKVIEVSSKTGEGMESWAQFLLSALQS